MKRLFLAAAAAVAFALPAAADDDPMATYYGNTLVLIDYKGNETHTYYSADHTFDGAVMATGAHYAGTWEVADGKICHTFDPPLPDTPNPKCNKLVRLHVGQTWALPNGSRGGLFSGIK